MSWDAHSSSDANAPGVPREHMFLAGYVLFPGNHFVGAWRHPYSEVDFNDRALFADVARTLERAGFDMAFIPETLNFRDDFARHGLSNALKHDPSQLATIIADATERLQVGVTLSASYTPPYHLARTLLSLDHLSGGRVWWNIIMSESDETQANFPDVRRLRSPESYERGDEVLAATLALMESWRPGALVADKDSGVFVEPDLVDAVDYAGSHVQVRGPGTLPRSRRGRIGLIQAGDSPRGRDFGSRWADLVFVIEPDEAALRAKREDLRRRAQAQGRDPSSVRTVAAVQTIVGETQEIAEARRDFLDRLVAPEAAVAFLSYFLEYVGSAPLGAVPADARLLDAAAAGGTPAPGVQRMADAIARFGGLDPASLTVGEAAQAFARSELTPQIVGTPEQVADELAHLFTSEAVDGFVISPVHFPGAFDEFGRSVIPLLRRRGLVRDPEEAPVRPLRPLR